MFSLQSEAACMMEAITTTAENPEVQQVINDRLEKVLQDFNEFREKMSQSSSSGAMKLEDLVDLYINNGGENSYSTSQTTQDHLAMILEDFNKFENMLPPNQVVSPDIQSRNGFSIQTQIQESEIMIKEMAEGISHNTDESFPASPQTLNTNSNLGLDSGSSSRVTYIRYGDLNSYEAASSIIGSVFGSGSGSETVIGSVMGLFRTWGVKQNAKKRTIRRKRVEMKYRGVTETEEETALQGENKH
ncbi:hypothetical protein Salat_0283700 [Sesamum alatum]|uniref:Uncharacterized protein n=1 Tax=Sesamum alatum TaxID=300844 RepID=A0AAE2CYS9_9LAMI|nr:hypothetical protein Salat_0283700 [Sesamum alatum]